ncbi:MAG: ABC transporter permease [Actinomycetia bacterium]|nr:ABC transporter permease [Actinomycetes bacterium]
MTAPVLHDDELLELTEEPSHSWLARVARLQAMQIVLVLIVLVVIFGIMKPHNFITVNNWRNIIQNTSIYAVLGVGMTFVIATAGIDLSIGSVLVFASVMSVKVMKWVAPAAVMGVVGVQGQPGYKPVDTGWACWWVSIAGMVAAVVCGIAWGWLNGFITAYMKVPPMIGTLGTLGMALGLADVITDGTDLNTIPVGLNNSLGTGDAFSFRTINIFGGRDITWKVPWMALAAAVVVIIGIFLLHRTKFGLHTFASGSNPESVRRAGINLNVHLVKVYTFNGMLAGFAGFLFIAFFGTTSISGQTMTNLNIIAGVVIGGTSLFGGFGSIFGTVIGLFIPTVLQNGLVIIRVQAFWQQVFIGLILVIVVWVDQTRRTASQRGSSVTAYLFPHLAARMTSSAGATPLGPPGGPPPPPIG